MDQGDRSTEDLIESARNRMETGAWATKDAEETVQAMEKFAPELRDDETIELLPIADIVLKDRQRRATAKDLEKHIARLRDSISTVGLLHPLTIEDETNELITGFCRMMACMQLGWTKIPVRRRGSLNKMQRKVIELEENLARLGLDWWQKATAVAEIHEIYEEMHPDETWSRKRTAEMIGESHGSVQNSIELKKALDEDPSLKEHKTMVGALGAVKTKKQLERRRAELATREAAGIELPSLRAQIIQGDALEILPTLPERSVDACITNFPFGVDLELKGRPQVYKDDEEYIVSLVRRSIQKIYRVLKDDSWFIGFFASQKLTYNKMQIKFFNRVKSKLTAEELYAATNALGLQYWLEEAGFDYVASNPCIWVKPNKLQGIIGDPRKGMIIAYEQFIFAAKGDPALNRQGIQNIFVYDTPPAEDRVHPLQMPVELTRYLVELTCIGGSTVLDPFAGSGSIGVGALERECHFIGIELDEEKAANGNLYLREALERLGRDASNQNGMEAPEDR